ILRCAARRLAALHNGARRWYRAERQQTTAPTATIAPRPPSSNKYTNNRQPPASSRAPDSSFEDLPQGAPASTAPRPQRSNICATDATVCRVARAASIDMAKLPLAGLRLSANAAVLLRPRARLQVVLLPMGTAPALHRGIESSQRTSESPFSRRHFGG